MDPYSVLGVPASASYDEVEAAYRTQVRAWHPDLHHHEGPAAVSEAEARTRALNDAMARIRSARDPGRGAGRRGPAASAWPPPPAPGEEWFASEPAASRPPVPCPFCGLGYTDLTSYEHHLAIAHDVRPPSSDPKVAADRTIRSTLQWLRYVPAWLLGVGIVASLLFQFHVLTLVIGVFLTVVLAVQTTPRDRLTHRPANRHGRRY